MRRKARSRKDARPQAPPSRRLAHALRHMRRPLFKCGIPCAPRIDFSLCNGNRHLTIDMLMEGDDDILRQLFSLGSLAGGEPRPIEYVGTKALMLAVLEEGIRNYCGPQGRVRQEAEAWVRSNQRSAFSFTVICEMLGFEPEAVRGALPRLQRHSKQPMRRVRPNARRTRAPGKKASA
jgi:hypothetical protein